MDAGHVNENALLIVVSLKLEFPYKRLIDDLNQNS